jgi:hypothetical protein
MIDRRDVIKGIAIAGTAPVAVAGGGVGVLRTLQTHRPVSHERHRPNLITAS